MKAYVLLLVLCVLLPLKRAAPQPFCSSYCATGCTDSTQNDCASKCNTGWGWIAVGGPCDIDPTKNRQIIDISDDAGGSITVTSSPVAVAQKCTNFMGIFMHGSFAATSTLTISLSGGTTIPHFAVDLIYSMILIDTDQSSNWQPANNVITDLVGATPAQSYTFNLKTPINSQKTYCGDDKKWDQNFQIKKTYTHTLLTTTISFTLKTDNSKATAYFDVRQFIFVAQMCHLACLTCTGALVNQCQSCDPSVPFMLSGTTCNQTCLTGYGYTFDPTVCVLCSKRCITCFDILDNCSSCVITGTWASFYYDDQVLGYSTCVVSCPVGYFNNITSRICQLCNPNCTACITTDIKCQACVSGFAWFNYTCFSPCNSGFFLSADGLNCTKCNILCLECITDAVTCSICNTVAPNIAYLSGTTCVKTCPDGTFPDTNNGTGPNMCLPCSSLCVKCTGNPMPCSQCTSSYLLIDQCVASCPATYYQYDPLNLCLDCSTGTSCVDLTINMYFPTSYNEEIYIDMIFSADIDFTVFDYVNFQTLSFGSYSQADFIINYIPLSTKSYRISIKTSGFIFLYNETIAVTTIVQPATLDTAISGLPFKMSNYQKSQSLSWFILRAPEMSDLEKSIINGIGSISNTLAVATTTPFVSEIKKSGLLAMLFSGAQITSCSIFVNSIPSQNLYEGARFWGIFVFFDVPEWQKNSQIPNHIVSPDAYDLVKNNRRLQQRKLFDMTTIYWRFHRTGQTSFFIFDVYIPLILISICWILIFSSRWLKTKKWFKSVQPKFFVVMHKIHQASILYITMATMLEWFYFDAASFTRWISLIICIGCNIYFVGYQLYIYYDMIKYPLAQIGNQKYQYYLCRYSCFLKRLRFQQYNINDQWSPKHWFRPYNYHILSYYKKFCMIICLPLFYDTKYTQASALILLQIMQICRFIATWPFYSKLRNYVRLALQIILLIFFITLLWQGFLIEQIIRNDPNTLLDTVAMFYHVGWIGFCAVWIFNGTFVIMFIVDAILNCRKSNREIMDEARRVFYYEKIKNYEKQNDTVPLGLMNKWVKQGNLNKRDNQALPDINLRVQCYRLVKHNEYYDVDIYKVLELYLNTDLNFNKENNTTIGSSIKKKIKLTKNVSPNLYSIIESIFKQYYKKEVEAISIKTFQLISQKQFKAGDRIPLIPNAMFQKIETQSFIGEKNTIKLLQKINGFPLNAHDLQQI